MITALAFGGWGFASLLVAWVWRLRRRVEMTARACHELRGPATAIALAAAALRREPGGLRRALPFEAQLDRLRAGLDDLEAARAGRRAQVSPADVAVDQLLRRTAAGWRIAARADGRLLKMHSGLRGAVVRADSGRLAQVLGNLLANAVEHGSGTVELRGRRMGDRVVLEVLDEGAPAARRGRRTSGRGRGLGIAAAAVEEAGGTLSLARREGATVAAVELPVAER